MKFAICQELYEDTPWPEQCQRIAAAGYTGIEVAPFSISSSMTEVADETLETMKRQAADHGLEIIGLHWLLAKTEGFYLTSPDAQVRSATSEYLRTLARVSRVLGGRVLVFGSPFQRNLLPGVTAEQAVDYAAEVFGDAVDAFTEYDVDLCMEPLTPKETNFINTCEEAVHLIQKVGHPRMMLHQDVKAMLGAESRPLPELIHQYHSVCGHFHVNDSNLLGPGMGETDYHPILKALIESGYDRWVSVEVFDYKPGADFIALTSFQYMQHVLRDLNA
ncbi:MAG: sugar phosphate isomerase/epimerase [Planctomycetaceae bacterium]|nr:sugar phosphate isomerase/epimerase [Planctomycetaceae bacterium]